MQNLILSSRIKKQCKEKKISLKTLLEHCNMNRNTIYDLEKKGSFPSGDKLLKIADYLDCSIDYLLGRTDEVLPEGVKLPSEKQKAFMRLAEQFSEEDIKKLLDYAEFLKKNE